MPTAEDRHGLVMPSAGQSSSSSGSPTASPAADGARSAADILRLNVSGVRYDVRRDVLRAVQGSLFMFLFSGRYDRHFLRVPDERTGEELMFLDIDHEAFQIMLEELRRYHGAGVELHCRPLPPPPHSDNPAMTFYFDLCLKPWSWEATRLLPRAHSHPSLDADKAATADTSKPTAALEPPPATTSTHTTPPDVCYSPSSRLSHRDIAEALQPFLHEWVVAKGIADNEPATASTSNGSSGSRQGSVWQGVTRSDEVVSVDVTASSSASGGNERVSVRVSTTLATIEGVGWDNRGLPTLLLNRFCRWHGPIVDVPPSRVRQMIDLCRRRRLQGCMRHSHPHPHHPHTPTHQAPRRVPRPWRRRAARRE
ncbi:unnamed protein product [Vitrella brassicaformis CCMP3155]|uniref:Potassium channel tetramerisation-type BTB domain-containing protein n=1 Tax=Vitrella brassicaformis (strain CCMP3155) TaxID=1169540 RepID=A0A0G4EQG0_VITBC|nr:unnamed protein product [Vitrella brassicaformis CCMP3155]|eukprot:CEL99674.1 unnamed protein product [Vitrella brassicaformis CCMP3155]